jgi:hypothetical protein
MAVILKPFLTLLILVSQVTAWGELGHRTVGYLAQLYFTPEATELFNDLILPTETFDISDGAIWADSFAVQHKYPYSKFWHYIDAKDDPPNTCQVNFDDDCDTDKHCIVTAIANQVILAPRSQGCGTDVSSLDSVSQQWPNQSEVPRRSSQIPSALPRRYHTASSH